MPVKEIRQCNAPGLPCRHPCMHAAALASAVYAQMLHMPLLATCSIWDAISRSDRPQGTYPGMASPCARPCAASVAAEQPPSARPPHCRVARNRPEQACVYTSAVTGSVLRLTGLFVDSVQLFSLSILYNCWMGDPRPSGTAPLGT